MYSFDWRKSEWLLFIVWLSFVVRGFFYCTAFPIFEGLDEYVHFGVLQQIFFQRDIPNPLGIDGSREIQEALKLVPVPWLVRDESLGFLSHEAYWRLTPEDRLDRQTRLRTLPSEWSTVEAVPRLELYEAQQPPLYYWTLLPVYWSVQSLDLPTRVWVLRCASVLLASAIIPISFLIAKRFFFNEPSALGVAVVVASMPQLAITTFRISNESLSVTLGGVAVLAVLTVWDSAPSGARLPDGRGSVTRILSRARQQAVFRLFQQPPGLATGILAGLALGAALLTKAYFLALLPWAAFVLMWVWFRDSQHRKTGGWQMAAALTTCLTVSGWFYWRAISLTGTITGEMNDVAAQASRLSIADAIKTMPWRRILDFVAVTHIWLGNWSFVGVRTWMYRVIELVFALGLIGLLLQAVRARMHLPKATSLGVLIMPYAFLLVGIHFQAVQSFRSAGNIGTMGYYLYGLIVPEVIVLLAGLFRLLPERRELLVVPVVALFFGLLEQFGTTFLLLPYYAGAIQHDGRGNLPTFKIAQLAHGGAGRMFANLAVNKPSFVTASDLMILMALSCSAVVALVSVGCAVAFEGAPQKTVQAAPGL